MTYHEAELAMQKGNAVARIAWNGALYLFIDRERVWRRYTDGRVMFCRHLNLQKSTADDWVIVDHALWPLVAPQPKASYKGQRPFARNLSARQAEMKSRWR